MDNVYDSSLCPVCWKELYGIGVLSPDGVLSNKETVRLSCGHSYHSDCAIAHFREQSSACLVCREGERDNNDSDDDEISAFMDIISGRPALRADHMQVYYKPS